MSSTPSVTSDLSSTYSRALAYITSGGDPSLKKPTTLQQLQFYALYKQESVGECKEKQPSRLQVSQRAKHDAWMKLGSMSKADAQSEYIAALTRLDPKWQEKAKAAAKIRSKL